MSETRRAGEPGPSRPSSHPDGAEPAEAPGALAPQVRVVLASGSPRRRALLARAGVAFAVAPAGVPEERRTGEPPGDLAERLAREKAAAVAARIGPRPPRVVLGADTVVALGDEVLGKPDDPEHAVALLRRLVGRTHRVVTGVARVDTATGAVRSLRVESRVSMRPADEAEIRAYVASGEPLDKAGAYAVQGEGRRFVTRLEGSETNVIGLPLDETLALLAADGTADGDESR